VVEEVERPVLTDDVEFVVDLTDERYTPAPATTIITTIMTATTILPIPRSERLTYILFPSDVATV